MKTRISIISCILVAGLGTSAAWSQTTANQPPGAYTPAASSGSLGASSLTFSNSTGQAYTAEQLATQLRSLRTAVDQTLPMLTAFNQSFAGTANQSNLTGRLKGLVSGALSRNTSSPTVSNLVSGLRGLLGTNGTASATTDAKTLADLQTLQTDLQPLLPLLSGLNVGSPTTPNPSQIISSPANAGYTTPPTNTPGAPPTPTGRQ